MMPPGNQSNTTSSPLLNIQSEPDYSSSGESDDFATSVSHVVDKTESVDDLASAVKGSGNSNNSNKNTTPINNSNKNNTTINKINKTNILSNKNITAYINRNTSNTNNNTNNINNKINTSNIPKNNKITTNSTPNTILSTLFRSSNHPRDPNTLNQDSDLLLLNSVQHGNEHTRFDTTINRARNEQNNDHRNTLRVIHSEPSSSASASDSDSSESNESMRLFRENVHLLEEQPQPEPYVSENEEENDSDNASLHDFNPQNIDKRQLTLWRFSNIDNLDLFFITFYKYYLKKGLYSYLIEKIINILILLFVLYLSISLKYCINYSLFSNATKLEDIWVDKCFQTRLPFTLRCIIWLVYAFIVLKMKAVYREFKSLQLMQNFYYYLLEIDDEELQIISWVEILNRLIKFKDSNNLFQTAENITFENIVNRIMRLDNYLIAIYSNETLMKFKVFNDRYEVSLTKSLEWNINLILLTFFFENGQFAVNTTKNARSALELDLINKFRVAGFINIVLTPFLVIYFTLLYVLKYFYNIKSIFNLREYNLANKYRLREYNELEHFFNKRLNLSIDIATEYLLQFPNNINNLVYKFLAFISGSLLAILTITTLIFDSENFLSFEITHNKSILFYISIIGAINTFTYNNIQQDKYKTYQPKKYFKELSKYTHFIPVSKKKLPNQPLSNIDIRDEFVKIYSLKLINILNEFGSLLLTPYILWFVLPKRCKHIISFMQEITEKDPELGYICKYANYKPSEDELRRSFFYMEHDDDDDDGNKEDKRGNKRSSIDVEELKFDKKRRIKDRLLRNKRNSGDKRDRSDDRRDKSDDRNDKSDERKEGSRRGKRTANHLQWPLHPYNLMVGEPRDENDKMKRSFMQFNRVYRDTFS